MDSANANPPLKVLVVDDEDVMREVLRERLSGWGHEVSTAVDAASARRELAGGSPDLVLADVMLPDSSGLELLQSLRGDYPDLPVVMITAHGSVDLAVEAMKEGALDFLTKPIDYDNLDSLLSEIEREIGRRRGVEALSSDLDREDHRFGEMVGASRAMQEVYDLIREAAPSDTSVLITGESGTGKEVTARTLHRLSRRAERDFVPINTAAIPSELMESELFGHEKGAFTGATGTRQGCFELAHEGTLFLDEVADMPISLQPKLLRVLEDGKVRRVGGSREIQCDVRLISATNQMPRQAIEKGLLREDLFYRLNVFQIHLPPLRERGDDRLLLVQHFLSRFNDRHSTAVEGLGDEAAAIFARYRWPGNIRELRNVMERAVVVAKEGWVAASHLPPYLRRRHDEDEVPPFEVETGMTVAEAEKALILRTLEETDNNKTEAARRLGIDVKTVRNKLKSYEEEGHGAE